MKIISIVSEDFINYKLPSMYIILPYCSFKCDKECGRPICQNSALAREKVINMPDSRILEFYEKNPITRAIVLGGLEPFDSEDLENFIDHFRTKFQDKIVIYTGYTEKEVKQKFEWIFSYKNIVIKFGRFVPNDQPHFDDILGVNLASLNQYAKEFL